MARCLVLGGNGFLGSWVVDQLVERGHEVTVFDRFTRAEANYTSEGVRAVVGQFEDPEALRAALAGQDYLFHFLSTTTPMTAESAPTLDLSTNVAYSVTLFELAVAAGVSRVYFASTGGAMYGNSETERLAEATVPAPVSPYAIGKLAIEGYLRYYGRTHGLESVTYRISNPYGPRQHPHKKQGVIPIFLERIARGETLDVVGTGSSIRDYLYAEDAARMIVDTVDRTVDHSLYNIASGIGVSLDEIVDLARDITGMPVKIEHRPAPTTFMEKVVLDPSRYRGEFGDRVLVPLREGMTRTWHDTRRRME